MKKIATVFLSVILVISCTLLFASCIMGESSNQTVYVDPKVDEAEGHVIKGSVTSDGEALSGVIVSYGDKQAVSMRDGSFILRSAFEEGGKMTFSKEGYFDFRYKVLAEDFENGEQNVNIQLTKCYYITGVVTDTWGNVLDGVKVSSGDHVAYSDENGEYKLDGLFASDRVLTYSKGEDYAQITRVIRGDWFEEGKIDAFDVSLHRLATLTGKVTDSNGNALAGVKVTCGSETTVTNADGTYTLTGIYPEPREAHQYSGFDVEFMLSGYTTVVQVVDFMSNFHSTLNVSLRAA